jgi:hypothetical protein
MKFCIIDALLQFFLKGVTIQLVSVVGKVVNFLPFPGLPTWVGTT